MPLEKLLQTYRAILDQVSDGIIFFDRSGRILEANDRAHEMTGYAVGEPLPSMVDVLLEEELRELPLKWDALARGEVTVSRRTIRRRDGSHLPAEIISRQVDERIVAMVRDLSAALREEQEIRRHREMDAELAALGRQAIRLSDPEELFRLAVDTLRRILPADVATVVEYRPRKRDAVLRLSSGLPCDPPPFPVHEDDDGVLSLVLRTSEPVVVEDWDSERRCRAPFLRSAGIRSGVSMVIAGQQIPFGVLGAHNRSPRAYTASEVLFIRSIATILAEFVSRIETERKAEESLLLRARQHEAVARLGQRAVAEKNVPALFGAGCEAILNGVSVRNAWIFSPDGLTVLAAARDHAPADRDEVFTKVPECLGEQRDAQGFCRLSDARTMCVRIGAAEQAPLLLVSFGPTDELRDTDAAFVLSIARILSDAVQRLASEEELARHRAALAEAESIAHLGSWEWDIQTGRIFFSDETYTMIGRTRADFEPQYDVLLQTVNADEREFVNEQFMRLHRGETDSLTMSASLTSADRWEKTVEWHARSLRDGAGNVIRLTGTVQDITEKRTAEMRIRRSEQRYRGLVERARDAIYTLTLDGVFASVNAAGTAITGWTEAELRSMHFTEIVHPDDRPRILRNFASLLKGEDAEMPIVRVRRPDGRYLQIDASAAPTVEDGRITGVFGIARDITDRVEAEAERERLRRRIELLLDSTCDGIIAKNLDGVCTLVNPAACRMLGYTAEEIIGSNMHDLVHSRLPNGRVIAKEDCRIDRIAHDRKPARLDDEYLTRSDGTIFPAEMNAAPMFEGDLLVGTVISFNDVTEKRALQQDLQRSERLTSLGRLAAMMAHEFNNVLMGIQPFAEVIRRRSADESISRPAGQIVQAVRRGRTITHEILRFSRPQEPVRRTLDLRAWLAELLPELRDLAGVSVELQHDFQGSFPLIVDGDGSQLAQVVTNLVANARDAMPDGGCIVLTARSRPGGTRFPWGSLPGDQPYAQLTVTDTGHGIPADSLARVFEPFFTTKRKGTGLGLAVAQQIVQAHGGRIDAESHLGMGTSFHLFLPLGGGAVADEPLEAEQERRALPTCVLIVEDDEDVACGLEMALQSHGIDTRVAPTGTLALEMLGASVPDAVILDVRLPDMNGADVYVEIARLYPTLPVVFSTGHADASRFEHMLSKSHVAFLMKPYDTETLLRTLESTASDEAVAS